MCAWLTIWFRHGRALVKGNLARWGGAALAPAPSKLALILLPEAISCWEKVPTPFLIHIPDICFLARVVIFVLVDEVHQEEEIVGEIVLFLNVDIESVRYPVQIVFAYAADEAVVPQLVLHALQLVTQRAERVNDAH